MEYVFVMSSTQQQQHDLKTLGEIADEIGKPPYGVAYIISSRGIKETRRAGIVRLFGPEAVEQIKAAAREMEKQNC